MVSFFLLNEKARRIEGPNGNTTRKGFFCSRRQIIVFPLLLSFACCFFFFFGSQHLLTCARYFPLGRKRVTPRYGDDFGGCGMIAENSRARERGACGRAKSF